MAQETATEKNSSKKKRQSSGSVAEMNRETRSQFESRMRRELQELFNSRMAELMKTQMEATRMTVEAAHQLADLKTSRTSRVDVATLTHSSPGTNQGASRTARSNYVSEDIKTMISNTESSIPEILSAVEATDRSAKDIQRSIKTAIKVNFL